MTERLYYSDSLLLKFKARVTGVDSIDGKTLVCLDKSAFYPTSGGQLFDTGNISGIKVAEVFEKDGEVYHVLENRADLSIGDKVSGKVDYDRRRDNMQKHTGQHILSRAMIEVCEAETISARLGEEDSTIDVNRENIDREDLYRAELRANEIIFQNRPVNISFVPHDKLKTIPLRKIPDREEDTYRIITIEDYDWSACGGTHCPATGSVGIIKICGQEKVHGNLRLHFLTGLQALEDYKWRFEQIEAISNIFTRHGQESLEAVESLVDDRDQLRKKNESLKRQLLPTLIRKWYAEAVSVGDYKIIARDFSGEDFKETRQAALSIINEHDVIAIMAVGDKLLVAVSGNLPVSAADLMKKIISKWPGRGGGSPQVAQGGGFRPEDLKVLIAAPGEILDI